MVTTRSKELKKKIAFYERERKDRNKKTTTKFAKLFGVGLLTGSLIFGAYGQKQYISDFVSDTWRKTQGLYENVASKVFSGDEDENVTETDPVSEVSSDNLPRSIKTIPGRIPENKTDPDLSVRRDFDSIDDLLDDMAVNNRGLLEEVSLRIRGEEDVCYMLHDIDHFSLMRIEEFVNEYEKTVKGVYMTEIQYDLNGVSRNAKIFNLYGTLEDDPLDDNMILRGCYLDHDQDLYSLVPEDDYPDAGVFVLGNSDREMRGDDSEITVLNTDYLNNDEFYSELLDSQRDGQKLKYSAFGSGNALLFSMPEEDNLYVDIDDEAFILSR